jgi:hypothetical protein
MKRELILVAMMIQVLLSPASALGQESSTLLNTLSFVSIGDDVILPISPGAIVAQTYASGLTDALALRVAPSQFGMRSMKFGAERFEITLASPATGFLRRTPGGGLEVELEAVWRLTSAAGSRDVPIRFTTEPVESWSADGRERLSVSGSRATEASRVLQLVGATTAGADDGPVPGAAIYVVLSGELDVIPPF